MKKTVLLLLIFLLTLSLCACAEAEVVIEAQEVTEIEVESPETEVIEYSSEVTETEVPAEEAAEPPAENPAFEEAKALAEEAEKFEAESPINSDNDLSQSEMNEASAEIYKKWDDCLNAIWAILKSELPGDEMAALKTEEYRWINEKEASVIEAGSEYEGGSMRSLIENGKAAELTKERVYILLEYLK